MEEMNGHTQSKKSFKAYKIGLQNYFSCLPVEMKFESWMKSWLWQMMMNYLKLLVLLHVLHSVALM